MEKIAIYSTNIGNYRNEIDNGIDNVYIDKNINYYFFTDNCNFKSKYWNVIIVKLKDELDFIDENRHTAKYIKFIVPKILQDYDIILYIDTKSLSLLKFKSKNIINFLNQKDKSVFFKEHPAGRTTRQALEVTCSMELEHKHNADKFLNKIKNIKFNSRLPDTTCFVYKNTDENIKLLKTIYDEEILNGLRRDQNVFQYALFKHKNEHKIDYFKLKDLWD